MSISGDIAVIGSPSDDDTGSNSGSSYVYGNIAGTWTFVTKLTAYDGAAGDNFGYSVSISGGIVVIGSPNDDENGPDSGSAYVYELFAGAWTFVNKVIASDGAAGDQFGASLSVSGSTAVIGSPNYDDNGFDSGSVYVSSQCDNWASVTKLTAFDGASGDIFGSSVSVSGDVALIGAPGDDASSGSAYVYEYISGTWTFVTKLTASDGAAGNSFGWSVSVSGNVGIIGSPWENWSSSFVSSVYVYENAAGTWTFDEKLATSTGSVSAHFGWSVSVSGNNVAIGNMYDALFFHQTSIVTIPEANIECPTDVPSSMPSQTPSASPSLSGIPSLQPSPMPSLSPSQYPSDIPSLPPSLFPSMMPSETPSLIPSLMPSQYPSAIPSTIPSIFPSNVPSSFPSHFPSIDPSGTPSLQPSLVPSETPSCIPSQAPAPDSSINLFYPDWSMSGFDQGCSSDGNQVSAVL